MVILESAIHNRNNDAMDVIPYHLCCPDFHQCILRKGARTSVPFHFYFEIFTYYNYFNKISLMDSSSLHTDRVHTFLSPISFLLRLIFFKKIKQPSLPQVRTSVTGRNRRDKFNAFSSS